MIKYLFVMTKDMHVLFDESHSFIAHQAQVSRLGVSCPCSCIPNIAVTVLYDFPQG